MRYFVTDDDDDQRADEIGFGKYESYLKGWGQWVVQS